MAAHNQELIRIGANMQNLLKEIKQKNNFKSFKESGEYLASYIKNLRKKRKLSQKIIREIEF